MADAALCATVKVVLEAVISLASDRIGLVLGFQEDLERLSRSAARIRGFLADADDKMPSPGVLDWLRQLEGEIFKADNMLDELNYENLHRQVKYQNQLKKKVCFFFSFFSTIGFRSRLASKIRDINTNLERINREASEVGLVFRFQIEAALPANAGATTSRQTDSVLVPNVVGRAKDESNIVETLLCPSEKVVSVIPIVGMGGLGKTTLAKLVYNNSRIDGHFGEKIWVCVAKEVQIVEIFKLILVQLTGKEVKVDDRNVIIQKIRENFEGKRYFLVLDDVWNLGQGLWSDFFTTLQGVNTTKGSWCLITTRLDQVAYIVSRHLKMQNELYILGKLSDDECWSILKGKVVVGEEIPKELEAIKKQILRKCAGLPLAASLIGGLLLNKGKEEWGSIVEESLLKGDRNDIKQIVKVSFDHLYPAAVKKCFAYCSIFPQDTRLDKDLVIELWMAERFFQPDPKNERLMEATGDNYFRILVQSSLLEKVIHWGDTYYKMHDLVHDFAKSVLNPESNNQHRYLALNSSEGMAESITKKIPTSLRTLFLKSAISTEVLSKFEYLHVLKLSGRDVKLLPTSIGELISLRFLDISNSGIRTLPESICKLYNLQTLRIEYFTLEYLPKKMRNLISLRHLHYDHKYEEFLMPSELGRLTYLQTLKFFHISKEKGRRIEELGTMKDLKGSLRIKRLELVNGKEGAKLAKLFEKPNLSRLTFDWGRKERKSENCDEDVLEGLQPHPNLQEIVIWDFMGDQFPQWLINLSALVKLELKYCKRCKELPALGQLPSLEYLMLRGLENITSIGLSFYGIIDESKGRSLSGSTSRQKFFPALKTLYLRDMKNLVEWKDADELRSTIGEAEVDVFPLLESVYIWYCPQLTTAPAPSHFPSLEKLKIEDNCQVSLAKKILSNLTTLSSLSLFGGDTYRQHSTDQDIQSLILQKGHCNTEDGYNGGTSLHLKGCWNEMVEWVLCHFPNNKGQESLFMSLEHMIICRSELTSLAVEMLELCTSLKELTVSSCLNLVSFPLDLQQMPSLESLRLSNCPQLITDMPKGFGFHTSLRELCIGPFSDYSSIQFDWSGLISSSKLKSLKLFGLPDIESLPHQLEYLTTLTELSLVEFGIETLPDFIGNLTSLEKLELWKCQRLRYLPSMAAMRCLVKLIFLKVYDCPLLEEQCTPESGIDSEWSKISHILERQFS